MQEMEDDSQKWFDLATDSEAEKSVTHVVDDSPSSSSSEVGKSDCKQFIMSQNPRSPESGSGKIEAKGCPEDMRNHGYNTSVRECDYYENLLPSYGQTSTSYDVREGRKDQSRACYRPLEIHNNARETNSIPPASQVGTKNDSRGETLYLTVRRRQPLVKSSMRPSAQGIAREKDFRRENMNVGWERCTVFDGEGSSFLAPESMDNGDAQSVSGRRRIKKEKRNDQVIDESTLKQMSTTKSPPRVERRSPLSSVDDRKFMNSAVEGSSSGSESDPKEMATQLKRVLINTSKRRTRSDLNSERISYPASPERAWVSKAQSRNRQQDHQSPSIHSSGLPRSASSRHLIADGSPSYYTPRRASLVDNHTDGQRKACSDVSNEKCDLVSSRNSKDNGNDHDKLALARTEQGSQRSLQLNPEYDQASWALDSKFMQRLNKISEGTHADLGKRVAQSSMPVDLPEPPSPTENLELKRKVEELERLVADERKKFQVVAEQLAEQQIESDQNVQQMQDDWDGKIRKLQKEKYALSIRLQSTETAHLASLLAGRGSGQTQPIQSAMQPANGSAPQRHLSSHHHHLSSHHHHEEFLKFENEKAMEKTKEVHAEAKEKARSTVEENPTLASLFMQYQCRGMSSGPLAATELSLQEALEREAQLKRLEVQLKKEIAQLKDELIKAHAELERREKRVSKTLDDMESEIARLKNSLTEERESHARTSLSMEDTMKSLAENQKLLSSQQSTIEQQAVQILELGCKVANHDREAENVGKIVEEDRQNPVQDKRSDSIDDRRIQPPLKQVSKDESDKIRKLQVELAALRKQNSNKEDQSNKSLHMLKHELENSKQEYEKRLLHLQLIHRDMDPPSANEQAAQNRVKALESQVVNIRIHSARKLKELTDKLTESKNEQSKLKLAAENAAQYKKIPPTRTIKVKELKDAKERISVLEDVLELKERTINILQQKLGQFQTDGQGDDPSAASFITAKQFANLSKIKSQIQNNCPQRDRSTLPANESHDSKELSHSSPEAGNELLINYGVEDELKGQKTKELKRLNSVTSPLRAKRDDPPHESEPDIVSLQKRFERTEVSREVLQQQCNEAMERAAQFSIQHEQSLQRLQHVSEINTEDQIVLINSAHCANGKNTSGGSDLRGLHNPLERENGEMLARERFRSMVLRKQ